LMRESGPYGELVGDSDAETGVAAA